MKTIYRSEEGKNRILALYDLQLSRLPVPWRDIYVQTSFGKTHVVEAGNLQGEPLLVFHGGNATTAYNLLACDFLLGEFHIYGVDIIGHPGKSAETSLPAKGYAYGKWAGEVIAGLGYDCMNLFGGSFGGGVVAKAMCEVPDRVKKALLYIPSGIRNAPAIRSASMMIPMILYWTTHNEKWLKQCFMPMAITEDNITDDIFQTAKLSIDHVRVKTAMPSDVDANRMKKCTAPALVMGAEKDCLFPGAGVIERAERIIPNCKTYLLRGRGHMHFLTDDEKEMIVEFLK